jgi:hypothetical protein
LTLSSTGIQRGVKHALPWAAWWLPLFWLWILLVGEWNLEQIVAAAIAATIAATLAEVARVRTGFAARVPLRALADVPQILGAVFVDFGVVVWALLASAARRRIVRGALVSRDLERGADAARGVGPRAWTALAASYSPNAYVIDIEPEAQTVLLHHLVPNRRSGSPA